MGYRIEPVQVEVLFQIQSINEGLYHFYGKLYFGDKVGDIPSW